MIIYYTPTETRCERVYGGFVRIVSTKYPDDSLLCSESISDLTAGEQLRVLRLRAGLTIDEAAEKIGVSRWTVMNYEQGRVKRMKRRVLDKMGKLYK